MNDSPQIKKDFAEYNRLASIQNSKVGCLLATVLMPAGSLTMDAFVYPDKLFSFFLLRLASGVLTALIYVALTTQRGQKFYRVFSMAWYWIPMTFIACMIYLAHDPVSPYYAGFNLVLIAVGLVLPWTYKEILATVLFIVCLYIGIYLFSGFATDVIKRYLANNLFFLGSTGVIVVTGSFTHSRARFREFVLRHELEENRKTIEENNRKLVELDQVKSRFFANISHELRTPLTLLIAPLESLMRRFNKSLDEETHNLLVTMQSNGMRLLKLINDLLDLVRLESGVMQVKREPVEVAEFVKGLTSSARQMADDKRLKLETFVDPALGSVLADRDKLEKIVLNLVFNALKFTPAGGSVELRAEKQDEQFVLIVKDTGMGISEKNLPNVFSRFWQADDSSRRKYQGVGIGLALVKELVEVQEGKVSVASQEGKGTTFTVRLPYAKPDPAQVKADEAKAAAANTTATANGTVTSQEWLTNLYRRAELFPAMTPLQESMRPVDASSNGANGANGDKRPTILVADDEPDMLRFLKTQLSRHYNVLEAVDGQQAVEKAAQFLPELILLDMMMPEKDGLQACREIHEKSASQSIPIVLLTARADEETKMAALSAGASDFLTKPFSTTELHVRIKNLVESHHYQEKLSKQNQVLETTIEQLKETETMLVQTEKMVSLGRMSAGIIHEINNPLNYATTGLYTLRNKGKQLIPAEQAEYEEVLGEIEDGINRVKSIVSDLKTFTHPDGEQLESVKIGASVDSALKFLSSEWKNKVQLDVSVPEEVTVRGNRNKLLQVFVNLLQNSLDAIRRKQFPDSEKPAMSIVARREGNKNVIVFRDNGEGIEANAINKIFDPFFTTKDVGEGMGLGLTICYRIVQEYEGRVTVRSERGKYCEFKLEFPVKE